MAMGSALIDEVTDAREDLKMLDKHSYEDAKTIRLIKQLDCFYCHRPWYISEAKLFFHQNKQLENSTWRFPTSCPECRKHNHHGATQSRHYACVSGKKDFVTAAAADAFSREALQTNGIAPQRAYQCPDCKLYHLTTQEPAAQASSGPLASPLGKAVQMAKLEPRRKSGERRVEIARLMGLGVSIDDIAIRLDMTRAGVYYHSRLIEGSAPTKPAKSAVKPVAVDELDPNQLDAEERSLYVRLEEIERKKAKLIAARMLRVEVVNGAISITKEGEHMLLPFGERDNLVEMLIRLTYVAAHVQQVELGQ